MQNWDSEVSNMEVTIEGEEEDIAGMKGEIRDVKCDPSNGE